jgi:S-methyl-5-thioribose-1-phosphate isomerase
MAVRGAPAIGATGAYAFVLGCQAMQEFREEEIDVLKNKIVGARPTAKDLETFVIELHEFVMREKSISLPPLVTLARSLADESKEECRLIGEQAKSLIRDDMGVLTHCNAGALATVDYGTALAPIRFAHYEGKKFKVFVDETRPRLQGMLTAWELAQEGIDHEIIVDNAAGFFMQQGKIQLVITGTDRVIRDGTVTNKIGTLEKAIVAHHFGIPVYIAMPWTTFDPNLIDSEQIPIEFRSAEEVNEIHGETSKITISPLGSPASNPAFDITPPEFITGYITKDGILKAEELYPFYVDQINNNN